MGGVIAGFSIRRAVLAGPRLIQRQPGIFAAWVVVELAQNLVYAQLSDVYAQVTAAAASSMFRVGPPFDAGHLIYEALAFVAVTIALAVPFQAVMWAAAFRAFLRPGEARFAYLRFGSVELRLAGLVLLSTLAQGILVGLSTVEIIHQHSAISTPMWRSLIIDIELLLGTLALVRFMLTPAILIDQNRASLTDSWRLTRSNFWSLGIPLVAWQVLRMAVHWSVGSIVHAVSDIAAARKLNWLVLSYPHGTNAAFLPFWMSIPRIAWITAAAVLETLSLVVIAGIATTAYRSLTISKDPDRQDQRA
jgi:hypothetical protein